MASRLGANRRGPADGAPAVRLGALLEGGIAPSVLALVDRGALRRPGLASAMRGELELRFDEGYPPVRITFAGAEIVVEDGPAKAPLLVVAGRLPDVVQLMTAPLVGGWPNPLTARGRQSLARIADGRVEITGRRLLARKVLRLLAVSA